MRDILADGPITPSWSNRRESVFSVSILTYTIESATLYLLLYFCLKVDMRFISADISIKGMDLVLSYHCSVYIIFKYIKIII